MQWLICGSVGECGGQTQVSSQLEPLEVLPGVLPSFVHVLVHKQCQDRCGKGVLVQFDLLGPLNQLVQAQEVLEQD